MIDPTPPQDKLPIIGPNLLPGSKELGPNEEEFQSLMKGAPTTKTNPLQINPEKKNTAPLSMDDLLKQVENTQNSLKHLDNNLNFPQLKLKKAHERLLKTKLENITDDIQGASKASKTEILPSSNTENMQPLSKFISFVGDGHNQLNEVKKNLSGMIKKNEKITPANMLLMQVKIAQAQQEIEFSSILLSKVVEGIRQTLNIQIQ